MKHILGQGTLFLAAAMLFLSGCEASKRISNRDKGVAVGAAGGAVIGGVIGNNVGNGKNTALGAIIGAAIGGVAGGIIGNKMDKQAEKIRTEIPGATVERVGEGISVTFDEKNPDGSVMGVYFATNQSNITSNSKIALTKLQKIFAEYPDTDILIEGHTDDVGRDAYNLSLSQKRAEAVSDYLVANGVAKTRITTRWYGEAQPKADNTTKEGKALNRRVEFAITANEKMKAEAKSESGQ